MSPIDGGALVGRALAVHGVEQAFGLCGGHIMPALYGMRAHGIEIIDVRHECSAIYAAIAYTRATGKTAAVLTTAGPGVANTTTGMMEAASMNIPIVHIGGAVSLDTRDAGSLQDMDTLGLMESVSTWARKVTLVERIPEYVALAFRHANGVSPGPAYLEIPTDLLFATVSDAPTIEPVPLPAPASGAPADIAAAATVLAAAERPALLLDEGAAPTLRDDPEAIAELSDYLQMPVGVAGSSCRGWMGDESENRLLNTNAAIFADVVVTMGCRFDWRLGQGQLLPAEAKIVQVHADPTVIGLNSRADIAITGGTSAVARQLLEAVRGLREPVEGASWTGRSGPGTTAELPEPYHSDKVPVHPARCAAEAAKFIERDARDWSVVIDGGEAAVWMSGAATAYRRGQLHGTGPNGTIGTAPGLAIGAWAADRKPVLWYTGDGSFGFYAMELDTMARLGIPVVCVISNDSGWGMISLVEKHVRSGEIDANGSCNTDLHPMRAYEKMVEMWGGHGEQVTEPAEIGPAIERAAANGLPSIINVAIDDESMSPFIAPYAEMVTG